MGSGEENVPVSMRDVVITSDLGRRASRLPDLEAENHAILELIQQLAAHPEDVLQTVVELCMRLCHADSTGISILETLGESRVFRWHAVAGSFAPNIFETMPENASPCGQVIARDEVMLFDRPGRFFSGLRDAQPRIYEALLAPWRINGRPGAALWILAHSPDRKFDSEDARVIANFAQFASTAFQMIRVVGEAKISHADLERRVEERTRALSEAFQILRQESADREQAEAQRAIAEQALRESEKLAAVGRLASSIAHEINNPLEAVTNLLYLAAGTASDPQTSHYLEQAQFELARVTRIATETLRFHRQSTNAAPVDLAEIVESVTSLHEARLRYAGIALERRFTPHHPLLCYPSEIRQVIANLVNNAIDSMKNSPGARLVLRVREAHHCKTGVPGVRLTVADTGTGMDGNTRRRAFEAFFTTKEATAIGLGLWVCREIVRKHNGEVRVQSCRGHVHHGSVFSVFLPYPAAAPDSHKPPQSARAEPRGITPSAERPLDLLPPPAAMAHSRRATP